MSLVALLAGAALAAPPPVRLERRAALMGTRLEISVEAVDRPTARAASERALRALEAAEARLSTWRSDSELARLNRAPAGAAVLLSPELAAELAAARRCWRATGGTFDPGVGLLVEAWGLRQGGRRPAPAELERALAAGGMASLRLRGRRAVREHPDLVLEEGAFGKGAGLDRALEALAAPGVRRARLDLGGQLAFFGPGPWRARVAHPRGGRPVVALRLPGGSVATSGNGERGIWVGGERLGHLLDPRRGLPAPDFGSLTVWTEGALRADCLATGLYVLGSEAALAWAAAAPGVEALVLTEIAGGIAARGTLGLRGRIQPLGPGVEVSLGMKRSAPGGAPRAGTGGPPPDGLEARPSPGPPAPAAQASHRREST